jgi:DNA uptake protein ComE-like DNA-binding protein
MSDHRSSAESTLEQEHRPAPGNIDRALVLIVIVGVIAIAPIVSVLTPRQEATKRRAASTIDPNQAPWWELTALPRIGETTARKVIAERLQGKNMVEGRSVFRSPADLQRVRGIGPKTVQRIAPFLHFQETKPIENDIEQENEAQEKP